MANSGKNSNTSQFYITLAEKLPQLDGKHVVFGRVVEGLEILSRIGIAPDSKLYEGCNVQNFNLEVHKILP